MTATPMNFPTPYLWAMFLPVLAIRTTARISTATGKGYEPCWNRAQAQAQDLRAALALLGVTEESEVQP